MFRKLTVCLIATVAFLQLSAGAATDVELEDHFTNAGSSIVGNITVDSTENVYLILDKDDDGQYSVSTDPLGSNSSVSGSGFYTAEINSSNTTDLSQGNYTLYARQSSSQPSGGDSLSSPLVDVSIENVEPEITEYQMQKINEHTMNVSFKSNESLEEVVVDLETPSSTLQLQGIKTGPEDPSDFNEVGSGSDYVYYAKYRVTEEGTYKATLLEASDKHNNDGSSGEIDSDSFSPVLSSFDTRLDNGNVQARILSNDNLSRIEVKSEGAKNLTIDESNFTESLFGSRYEYIGNISTDGTDGEYNATLYTAQNGTGYEGAWNQSVVENYGLPPSFDSFFLYEAASQDVDLSAHSNEQLSSIEVFVNKTVDKKLTIANFTETSTSEGYNYTADINSGVDGGYNATLKSAEDANGYNDTYNLNDTLTVDNTAPTISNYAAYESSKGNLNVTFLSDEELAEINVSITGQETAELTEANFSTPDTTPDYNYTASYEPGSDGTYSFELVEAKDANGNDGSSSENDSVTVETPPKISVFNLYADNQDVDLEIESSEDLTSIGVDLGGDTSGSLTLSDFNEQSTDPWVYNANVSEGSDGTFNATLTDASDTDGNDGSDGEDDEITVDTQPPQDPTSTDIVNEPINSNKDDSLEAEVYFNSIPEDGIITVKVYDGSGNTVTESGFVDTSTTDQTISPIDVQSLNDGDIWLQAKIEDNEGNENPSGFTANSSKAVKDTQEPQFDNVVTGEDASKNNTDNSKLTVEYTEANSIDSGTLDTGDFLIDSGNIGVSSVSVDSQKITVELGSSIGTGEKPTLEVDGAIRDSAGNKVPEQTGLTSEDGLKPTLEKAVVDPERSNDSSTVVEMKFSEDVNNGNGVEFAGTSSTKVAQGGKKLYLNVGSVLETGNSPQISSLGNVTDTSNNFAASTSKTVSSFETTLSSGWDSFSLPVEETQSYDISNILDESKISAVWTYSGEWKVYSPSATGNDFSQFKPGKGYLVNSDSSQTVRANVDTRDDGNSASLNIEDGWNLVANMEEYSQSADTSGAFSSLSSIERVEAQNVSGKLSFERIGSGSSNPKDVQPGQGYWLKSGSSDTLTGSFAKRPPTLMTGISEFLWSAVKSVESFVGGLFR